MNKKLTITFDYEGKTIKKTAIMSESLRYVLDREENNDVLYNDYNDEGFWSISFIEDEVIYEVEFTHENCEEVRKVIVWSTGDNGVILDEFKDADVSIRNTAK